MSDFIFNPDSVFSENKNPIVENSDWFTLIGQEDFLDDDGFAKTKSESNMFAKKSLRKDGSIKYSIRLSNDNKLYNPTSIYGAETKNTFLDRICRSNKKFKEVNEKTFTWYIKFLNTKNISWFYNAEREME